MAHLVDYEKAGSERDKVFTALVVAEVKSAKRLAWSWANWAIEHAVNAKLCSLQEGTGAAGDGRYPDTDALRSLFKGKN